MGESKQVRVDNWGIFFLQRLQMFFSKTDYCDLTLQFEGNVQLKVHRLVMNACTEYFELLENDANSVIAENVLLMPHKLQADVMVPIVNFMYTGMLEFHQSLFEKLYQAAEMMKMTVLTKLLDAQRKSAQKNKKVASAQIWREHSQQVKKVSKPPSKPASPYSDLPATLPGRKLPVWKRKYVPTFPQSPVQKFKTNDALSQNATAKPTRFEWPEEELPQLDTMDSGFGDISLSSKPLLKEEEVRASTSEDKVNHIEGGKVVFKENPEGDQKGNVENYDISNVDGKRKVTSPKPIISPKRIKITENNKETTINIMTSGKDSEMDPAKLVSEIVKKYPYIIKHKKNIKLKIVTKNSKEGSKAPPPVSPIMQKPLVVKNVEIQHPQPSMEVIKKSKKPEDGPWVCDKCVTTSGTNVEFVLYYLYRKHMTDMHDQVFDPLVCKYCGHHCQKSTMLTYHLYIKHGMKPPSEYEFPKCDCCPFIAISESVMQKHKNKHRDEEKQCSECSLAFANNNALVAHLQITGHLRKTKRTSYDCQYCMKRVPSAYSLISHVKSQHLMEAKRDGIAALDDIDVEDELVHEDNEEYVVPEIFTTEEHGRDKVKILSNVKVEQDVTKNQPVTIHSSTQGQPLQSGIATSLGLVDIVVLDDNQQYILHNQQTQNNEHSEYILPEIENNTTAVSEVITDQGIIPAANIGSTDELVMVLTDQDYQEGQTEISGDNSNIVVLYSHPVDGQQGQFITSQGNLLVNSQTGMLEIRNGATITTSSATQLVMSNPQDSHIETIEMIQREIDSHNQGDIKDQYYEVERKPDVHPHEEEPTIETQQVEHVIEETQEHQNEYEETVVEHEDVNTSEVLEEHVEHQEVEGDGSFEAAEKDERHSADVSHEESEVDSALPINTVQEVQEEPMEVEYSYERKESETEEVAPKVVESEEVPVEQEKNDEGADVPPSEDLASSHQAEAAEDAPKTHDEDEESFSTLGYSDNKSLDDVPPEDVSAYTQQTKEYTSEAMDVDEADTAESNQQDEIETNKEHVEVNGVDVATESTLEEVDPQNQDDAKASDETQASDEPNTSLEESERVDENEEVSQTSTISGLLYNESESKEQSHDEQNSEKDDFQDRPKSGLSNCDDTSQVSHDTAEENRKERTKIAILDDWDDTDSQQSDPKEKAAKAEETVHKLMDDWEDEEEEVKKDKETE